MALDKVTMVKVMCSEADETIINAYLDIAAQKVLARAYPFDDSVTEVPGRYKLLQCEIAAYLINKRGAEGQTAHSENGISRSYENGDVPESLLSAITPMCGVIST